jgi:hypothetical protein
MKQKPEGRILKVQRDLSEFSRVILDNGTTNTITILSRPDQLPGLLDQDMDEIREHLMTHKPGHFRKKRT